ncbi:ammonium transporter [Hydrogenovibrio sp. JE_KL2]|uniref:ammonium transporter n=1 Tax=Hydrogenovibrio sp. JE_KL2 TaxID=2651188 RepID=UPI00128BED5D|nr:ammonium transporter [Hydrogenovibrio sp. JE_KL2]MBN2606791.1 ammonium transporter [Thiotrichales bacterium]MPQ77455.1 ammonium transporter [Hydrogenovibrio sp. JE_KL2]
MEHTAPTLESLHAMISMSDTVSMEIFYWFCTALMVIIHVGFLAYEMGASRLKNALASGVKNILAFAFMVPTFFFVGWWIYLSMYNGFVPDFEAGAAGLPWSENMGPNLTDNASGIFWGAFVLFAATTASILSGAVIERIRMSAFLVLSIILGSVIWILAAAWGWSPSGWLTKDWGFHDFGAAGCVHMVAGFFALGVVLNLGPRIGRFGENGEVYNIAGHSTPMSMIGLMLIVVGFFGFLGGCIIYVPGEQWTSIFGTPTTLSAISFNTLMAIAGGIIGAYLSTRQPFWMLSGAIAGIVAAAPGLDLYYPPLAFMIAMIGGGVAPLVDKFMTHKLKVDDPVGAFSVHGISGLIGIVMLGVFSGFPNVLEGAPAISFMGQLKSAIVMALLGFVPGFVLSYILAKAGVLRVPPKAEMAGLDAVEVPMKAYPESVPQSPDVVSFGKAV